MAQCVVRVKPVARPEVTCILESFPAGVSAKCLLCNDAVILKVTVGEGRKMGQ